MNVFQTVFERKSVRTFRGYLSSVCRYVRKKRVYHFWYGIAGALREHGITSESRVRALLAEGEGSKQLAFLDNPTVVANWYAEHQRSIEGAYRGYVSYEGGRSEGGAKGRYVERVGSRKKLRVAFYCGVSGIYEDYKSRKGKGRYIFRFMKWCVRYVF